MEMYEFIAKDRNTYFIDLGDGENIEVFDENRRKVGTITFMHVNAGDEELDSYFYLQHLDLENCKRLGIGTEVFRLHNEFFAEPITAASEYGPKFDDGSYLTGDGIPFVAKMRKLGLICEEGNDESDMNDE